MEFVVDSQADAGGRIDRFLAARLPELSRGRIQALIRDGDVTLNGDATKPRQALAADDIVRVTIPPPPADVRPEAEDIPLEILHEDDHLVVVDKPAGLVVHPGAGNSTGTLVNALLQHCGRLAAGGDPERPGIVHRLDKDTSGCLVAARTEAAYRGLVAAFSGREVTKVYLTVVDGRPPADSGTIENRIARNPSDRQKMAVVPPPSGKPAVTSYHVRTPRDDASLVECLLHTGRTHQIRVHMKSLGCPVLGDPIYARPARQRVAATRLMLHAWQLGFEHPVTGEPMRFESPPPPEFAGWL